MSAEDRVREWLRATAPGDVARVVGVDDALLIDHLAAAFDEGAADRARLLASLEAERALRREHSRRIGWAESLAAAAMRQGLDALTLLRERRERLWERVRIAEGVPARASWLARMRTLTRERDEARAIVAGRTVAPTDAELEAHAAAGGGWRVRAEWSRAGTRQSIDTVRPWATGVARLLREQEDTRWWATDADGVLCAWPAVATEERAAR